MPEIIPNWHPIFVHFTVALFSVATAGYLISLLLSTGPLSSQLRIVARWNLWLGMGLTLITLLSGGYAYNTVLHDTPSHLAMTDHRNWALGTAGLYVLVTIWSVLNYRAGKETPLLFVLLLLVATLALGATAWRGGELVYRYGLGVMSLPDLGQHEHAADEKAHAHDAAAGGDTAHEHGNEVADSPPASPATAQDKPQPHEHKEGSAPHTH